MTSCSESVIGSSYRIASAISPEKNRSPYSTINVEEVDFEDFSFWQEADRILQQIIEEALRQERRQTKGMSL
ncbi:hypothetical protein H6G36_29725 [Anabaena minutissima FACHB-250]|nr:hypothetical protein [Anabaena minutissima FACHB-250]